jgi:VanZ family protein
VNWVATALRIAAWSAIGLLAVLSLLPAQEMVRTGLGGHLEHILAYAGASSITASGYPEKRLGRIGMALICYAGALEFLQRFSPGRHSAVEDWLASSAGVLVGCALILLWRRNARSGDGAG